MAVARMAKVIIVTHRSQASDLLEALQAEGICQILNAQQAMVSKDLPELGTTAEQPNAKDIRERISRLEKSIAFLKNYAEPQKGLASVLSPRAVIDEKSYNEVVADAQISNITEQCSRLEESIEKAKTKIEHLNDTLQMLYPWKSLETPVQEIARLQLATCWAGLVPTQHFEQLKQKIIEIGAEIQQIGPPAGKNACLVASLKENAGDVQKILRSAEFDHVTFEGPHLVVDGKTETREPMTGTVSELIDQHTKRLDRTQKQLKQCTEKAAVLSRNLLKIEILLDHYNNLLNREHTRDTAPATEHTVILEGWVRKKDFSRLEKTVSGFEASSLTKIKPAKDEEIPVEIENKNVIKPFEVITRLYGMPQHFEVDPTSFLAPFFALFFALCLTDAGYGIVIVVLMAFLIKKMQGDKKLMWMIGICSVVTVGAGALTGGWFGDAVQQLNIGWLSAARSRMIWFDPLDKPMNFFYLSLALGYFQIMVGLVIAFGHNLKQKNFITAICDQLTWLVMLNSIVIFGASKFGQVPAHVGSLFGKVALVPAAIIFLFSHREGGLGGRLGMGAYNLFSAIFYMGDVLSYLRLMALGMVTAGLAMAINVIAGIAAEIPYGIGFVLMIVVLVSGHGFNIAMSGLSAFVHTLRLQYVEFFPKFFVGGGRAFDPLSKQYKHIYIGKTRR